MTKFVYRNRYSDEIVFENTDVNTLKMTGGEYYRFGAENEQMMKDGILDMVDPSGGPFIGMGYMIEGRKVKRISAAGDLDGVPEILLEVE